MKGFVRKNQEGDNLYYVYVYSCNKRCAGLNDHIKSDQCCVHNKFILDKESQEQLNLMHIYNGEIEFTLLEDVSELIGDYIGCYAKLLTIIK